MSSTVNPALVALLKNAGWSEETVGSVARELSRLDPVDLVAAIENGTHPEDDARRERFRFLSAADLSTLPPHEWLVDGIIPRGGFVVLVGAPERFKTFIALDLHETTDTGSGRWLNSFETQRGRSIYVYAEGDRGLSKRVTAWADYHGTDAQGLYLIEPMPLMDDEATAAFVAQIRRTTEEPALIVFDTLARCMVGGDENFTRDMGVVIANIDRVRDATGATVLLIHHTTKGGEVERGSSALRGACDTMLQVVGDVGNLVLRCEKQKDAPHFSDIPIRFLPHLESGLVTARIGYAVSAEELTSKQLQALESLHSGLEPGGLSASKWLAVSEQKERTFWQARKALHDKGFVTADKVGRGARYTLTSKGEKALAAKLQVTASDTARSDATHCMQEGPSLEGPQQGAVAAGDVEGLLAEVTP